MSGQTSLTQRVLAADVTVLQQRLTLLDKQWAEMDNQVTMHVTTSDKNGLYQDCYIHSI